jgi:hypothetical protein
MKQIWPNYSYSPTTNVLTLTGLNIDRDQLLLVTAADRGRIMYNFADSSVTASAFTSGANTALTLVATTAGLTTTAALVIYYDDQLASNSVTVSSLPAISGTVTVNSSANFDVRVTQGGDPVDGNNAFPVYGTVTAYVFGKESFENTFVPIQIGASGESFLNGNRIGVSLINDAGTEYGVTGSPLSISGTVTANGIASNEGELVPDKAVWMAYNNDNALQGVGNSTPLPISGTVAANTFAVQGTAVTTSNFTSTTASTVLANFNATREVLTIFNEGAGNLHICAGATCTTIAYQVRLSAGDYYEVPNHQTSLTHSAVFATAGTARIVQIS